MTGLLDLLDVAREAAAAAGFVVRQAAAGPVVAETKSAGDYVTAADRAAEAAAVDVLRRRCPATPVVGEEGGGTVDLERCWLVDPIDGTTNFMRGFPIVGVSVALVQAGRPVVGVVEAPMLGSAWSACAGEGVHDHRGRRLSGPQRPGDGVVATGFPFRHKERLSTYLPVFERATRRFEDIRRAGAASLDLAFTAAGVWDGFFELGLGAWDIAAGTLLVRESGGVVTDWNGDPLALFESGNVLAGSPPIHEALLEIVRSATLGGDVAQP